MPSPIIRYPLDVTGINPDNFVSGEIKTLAVRPIRAVVPSYGPFFNDDTLVVFDNTTGTQLVKNVDYKVTGLLQEATFKIGKEICEVILILNTNVSSQVRINYQSLGGLYQSNSTNLKKLWDTIMQDSRPVDWESIFDKPYEFPPALHSHLLSDLYGFEPLVSALERLRAALILGDVPAFELVLEQVRQLREDFLELNTTGKQDTLVSGSNIKTINGETLLGAGNIVIESAGDSNKQDKLISGFNIKSINGVSLLGSGNINITGGTGSVSTLYGDEIRSFKQLKIDKNCVDENNNFIWTRPEGCVAVEIYAIGAAKSAHYHFAGETLILGDNGISSSLGISIIPVVPETININIGFRKYNDINPLSIQYDAVTSTLGDTASGFITANKNGISFNYENAYASIEKLSYQPNREMPIANIFSKTPSVISYATYTNYGEVYIVEWYSYAMPQMKTINGESIVGSGDITLINTPPIADFTNDIYPLGCLVGGNYTDVGSVNIGDTLSVFKINGSGTVSIALRSPDETSYYTYTNLPGIWRAISVTSVEEYVDGDNPTYVTKYSATVQRVA